MIFLCPTFGAQFISAPLSGETQGITDGRDFSAPLSGETQEITDEKDISASPSGETPESPDGSEGFDQVVRGNAENHGRELVFDVRPFCWMV